MATELALAQLAPPTADAAAGGLGFVYVTEQLAPDFDEVAQLLRERTGVRDWVGTVGHGICAAGVEYSDEPAIVLMVCELEPDAYRLFSGRKRLADAPGPSVHTALVHADPGMPELPDLLVDIAGRTETGYLFGGIASGGAGERLPQLAGDIVRGGLSGVAFSDRVRLLSRVTQGCAPIGAEHEVSECSAHYIERLDGQPALDVLLADLGVDEEARQSRDGDEIMRALPQARLRRGLLIGLSERAQDRRRGLGDFTVRNVIGIDPHNRVLAISGTPQAGDRAVFCTRDQQAARADLIRICAELRDEVETEGLTVRGALYYSCVARGSHLFGAPGVEMDLIRHNLGDVPLVGFYANGEIARDRLYGYTGVLTLFV